MGRRAVNQPGSREITTGELPDLTRAELPDTLPLDGWNTVTLHCQVDAIGPSELHPDLVKLELSFPPETAPEACRICRGRKVVPPYQHLGRETPQPCPACSSTCTATALHAVTGAVRCSLPAGHYDEEKLPIYTEGDPRSHDPGGWHQSAPDRAGRRLSWNDKADAATPHAADRQRWQGNIAVNCSCGWTALEEHPRLPGVWRCVNCKEHLARGCLKGAAS
ncbi:hypothetical protein SUDANB91_07186 (plasmid) [Streptomyces sp. SudanB91_2054]